MTVKQLKYVIVIDNVSLICKADIDVCGCLVTSLNCHKLCKGQCYGSGPDECCNELCTGGCSGPSSKDCWVISLPSCSCTVVGFIRLCFYWLVSYG